MTLQTYLLLLRPGRTIAAAAIIGLPALLILASQLGAPSRIPELSFVTWCLLVPVVAGSLLIAPLHEVAHRSGFPLLPGADRQLFSSHLLAFSLAALVQSGIATLFVSAVPAPAACGLILFGLALPQLDSHRGKTIGGISAFGLLVGIGLILAILARTHLVALGQLAPWSLFAGGVVFAIVCFRLGFARDHLRARSANPFYFAPQSTLLFVGTDIQQHAQMETSRLAERRSTRRVADWSAPAFRNTLRDWLRIVHQARFGKTRWSRSEFSVFTATLAGTIAAFPVAALWYAGTDLHQWEAYCRFTVAAALTSGEIANSDNRQFFVLVPQVGFTVALVGAIVAAIPAGPFPLARARLADVLFLSFERRVLLALAGSAAATVLLLASMSAFAGVPWQPALLQRFLPLPGLALVAINLLPVAMFSRHTIARIAFVLLVYPGYIITTFAALFRDSTLSPVFALGLTALALGSVAYTWFTFRRHYRTCDLNRTSDCLRRLGFRLG